MLHNLLIAADGSGNSRRAEDEDQMNKFFGEAKDPLVQVGLKREQIKSKFGVNKLEIADAILSEAELGKYDTLILGKRGLSLVREFFLGSISAKVVREARGCTVCVVE